MATGELRSTSELAEQAARLAQAVFDQEGWTYHDDLEVPGPDRLQGTVTRLLERVRAGALEADSGRFVVRRTTMDGEPDGGVEVLLDLGFFYGFDKETNHAVPPVSD